MDPRSYRPISNLSVVSKLMERLVAQLLSHLQASGMLPRIQSAYRAMHHSTEAAAMKVLSDILLAIDSGDLSVVVLLDLSAAFDTVDHSISTQKTRNFVRDLKERCCRLVAPDVRGRSTSVRASGVIDIVPSSQHAAAVYHRGPSWARYYFYCTPPTCLQ